MDHTLNAYIPIDRRYALARGTTLPDRTSGAALFADISGFTPLSDALARELGASVATLNPVEGLTAESTDDYFSLMRKNLATLMQANQCTGPTPAAAP